MTTIETDLPKRASGAAFCFFLATLLTLVCWSYWPTLVAIAERWSKDAQYSHGYLVPIFSLFLLWHRRSLAEPLELKPHWLGVGFLLLASFLHGLGSFLYHDWFQGVGFVAAIGGAFVCSGGKKVIRWAWVPVAFLFFMLPLPYRIETGLSQPLRSLATRASTYTLQTVGLPAVAEGNVILMENVSIGVIDACNGLGMLVTFFALTTGYCLLSRRSVLVKAVVVCSAVPIALVANTFRIVMTSVLAAGFGGEAASSFFHDGAGLLMIPVALVLLWLELQVISRLFVDVVPRAEVSFARTAAVLNAR